MNYGRIALAAVVATVVDFVYGFIVYGNLLANQFSWYPNVYRAPKGQLIHMPLMVAGFLVAMCVAVFIYSKGYEGKDGPGWCSTASSPRTRPRTSASGSRCIWPSPAWLNGSSSAS